MSGKSLLCLATFIGSVLGLSAGAVTTSKNVDIIVTHGAALTTSTYVNTSSATVAAGTPLLMAQAFRRGDVSLNTNCAIPRNAVTHNPLVWQRENTATRHLNGDDGSVEHWTFGVLTDAAVPAGGHYSIEWVSTGGGCPAQTPHQTLAALASAHDLKLRFTNVVNQDLTMRGSGTLSFDINAAASNTGRDAPTKYATGPVYDGWRIVGPPTWDTASSGRLIGAMLSPMQMASSNWSGITNGSFHVAVDGAEHDVTGINVSAATSMADVASAINARLRAAGVGATMSFDPNDQVQRFELFANSTGTSSSVSFLTAVASGTDISAQLLMTAGATSYNSQVDAYTQAGVAAGSADPLLYVVCHVDVTTQSDGSTLGKVRPSCGIYNGWLNVKAGSAGNPGAPGPAGYANDPQTLIYRPAMLDGATVIYDFAAKYDATVTAASNPVYQPGAADACLNQGNPYYLSSCWDIPASSGNAPWIEGGTHVFTTTGTPPTCEIKAGGTTDAGPCNYIQGHYYGDLPSGTSGNKGLPSTYVSFSDTPVFANNFSQGAIIEPTSQGTGTHTFSYRLTHFKFNGWWNFTPEGYPLWSDGSVAPFDIAFDQSSFSGERRYWEETGTVPPMRLTGQSPNVAVTYAWYGNRYYEPMSRTILDAEAGGGNRPWYDVVNEYAGACWYTISAADCQNMRVNALAYGIWQQGIMLSEVTGMIPVFSNGPLNGPNGLGTGTPYPVLGQPYVDHELIQYRNIYSDFTDQLEGAPVKLGWGGSGTPLSQTYFYEFGLWGPGGTFPDHEPEFAGLTYLLDGNPAFLDMIYFHANRANISNNQIYTDPGNSTVYYAQIVGQNQVRGGWWRMRDLSNGVALGDDTRPERSYLNDVLTVVKLGWDDAQKVVDGPGYSNALENSLFQPGPDAVFGGGTSWGSGFMQAYGTAATYRVWQMTHHPLGKELHDRQARIVQAMCGHTVADWPNYLPAYQCTMYNPMGAFKDGAIYQVGQNVGYGVNQVDASNTYEGDPLYYFTAGSGQIKVGGSTPMTAGDYIKNIIGLSGISIDQMDNQARDYLVIGPVDQAAQTFYIQCNAADAVAFPTQCPVAGGPFTSFTRGGSPLSGAVDLAGHQQYDNGSTAAPNYISQKWQEMSLLSVAQYDMTAAINQWTTRFGTITDDGFPWHVIDPSIIVR